MILTLCDPTCRDYSKVALAKKEVMPKWASTKSLLLNHQTATNLPRNMNSEVLAPLFKTPPTDFATLYTVLRLTQNISAVVVGPERRTIIELDLDLYQRAVQIQPSVKNKNWILKAGVLHICFAALHAMGKTGRQWHGHSGSRYRCLFCSCLAWHLWGKSLQTWS